MNEDMTEEEFELFQEMLQGLLENKSATPPENPAEFDAWADNDYNVHMFIKGEWQSIGINLSPLSPTSTLYLP